MFVNFTTKLQSSSNEQSHHLVLDILMVLQSNMSDRLRLAERDAAKVNY